MSQSGEVKQQPADHTGQRYRLAFVLLLTVAALAAFLTVIQAFILDILLAAIFAGMLWPLFKRTLALCGGRRALAVSLVVGTTALAVALPFVGVMALVGAEAVDLSKGIVTWTQHTVTEPGALAGLVPDWLSPDQWLEPVLAQLRSRIGEVIQLVSAFLSRSVSSFTQGAIGLFLHLFVTFFGIFYFLQNGAKLVKGLIDRVPLADAEARVLIDKSLRITAATLKSIVVVGVVQGALVGLAFFAVDLGRPWFWGAVVAISSAVPALGAPIVYVPAAIYLVLSGQTLAGIGLALWGIFVVGLIDNFLRLHIIGRGAALPDFLVFISTIGGLIVLGAPGLLIGPVLAGFLLGVLDLYQLVLPATGAHEENPSTPALGADGVPPQSAASRAL